MRRSPPIRGPEQALINRPQCCRRHARDERNVWIDWKPVVDRCRSRSRTRGLGCRTRRTCSCHSSRPSRPDRGSAWRCRGRSPKPTAARWRSRTAPRPAAAGPFYGCRCDRGFADRRSLIAGSWDRGIAVRGRGIAMCDNLPDASLIPFPLSKIRKALRRRVAHPPRRRRQPGARVRRSAPRPSSFCARASSRTSTATNIDYVMSWGAHHGHAPKAARRSPRPPRAAPASARRPSSRRGWRSVALLMPSMEACASSAPTEAP